MSEVISPEIIIYIFSWKRVSENARDVFDEIRKVHQNTYILNCDENFKMERENVIEVDDSYWYSKQFFTGLRHCVENFPGSYYMCLTGDVSPNANWKDIILRTQNAFVKYNAGVVAPNTDITWHVAKTKELEDNYWLVPNTDCTVWTLHPEIYNLLLKTDFEIVSKIGWGIDLIANNFSSKKSKLIIRDYNNIVMHPKDRGYGDEAIREYHIIQFKWEKEWKFIE